MSQYPLLSRPITINRCEIPNRIVRAAHGTGLSEPGGMIGDRLIAYHRERARGGVGLTILETSIVDPALAGRTLAAFCDEQIERWAKLAEACHAEGMKLFQQVFHPGPTGAIGSNPYMTGRHLAANAAGHPGNPFVPLEITPQMIDWHVAQFAAGARRMKAAGLDGVEVHGAHGYLLADFLSPLTNQRTDDYGGSLENRLRFLRRVIEAVRAAVGPDLVVGVRLSGTEWVDGGLVSDDMAEIALILEATGLIDYVSLTSGTYFRPGKIIGGMHEPRAYEIPDDRKIAPRLKIPTMVTGRIITLREAEDILAEGVADMVSMVRATIADPDLVRKSLAGRPEEVRPCISCNQACIGGLLRAGAMGCVVNVRAGAEAYAPAPPAARKAVVVVGAGPAGMEAALVAARRGHKVEVYEAAPQAGGSVAYARRAPHRADIGLIVDYQLAELQRLGVPVHLGSPMTPERVAGLDADAVILATGGAPSRTGRQRFNPRGAEGVGLPHVKTMQQVLGGEFGEAATALVFDDFGQYPAVAVAEFLLERGLAVTFATSEAALGTMLAFPRSQAPTYARLSAFAGFRVEPYQAVKAITPGHVVLVGTENRLERTVAADLVVMYVATEPRREIADAFPGDPRFIFAGDALGHGDLAWAIASGTRAGEAI